MLLGGLAMARPAAVGAHALRIASVPADGAVLQRPPSQVSITFGEEPDPALSRIQVLDTAGRDHVRVGAAPDAADPRVLVVAVSGLSRGVYSVSWLTVSRVDGHRAAGAFAFGVGVSTSAVAGASAAAATQGSSGADPVGVVGRFLFYAGLVALVGCGAAALWVFGATPGAVRLLATGGLVLAIAGALIVTGAQAADAGLGIGGVWRSSIGRSLLWRGLPLGAAAAGVAAAYRGGGRRGRAALGAAGAGAALALLADAANGHAAAQSTATLGEALQWAHALAAAVWIGGLAALLACLRGLPPAERGRAAARFSAVALAAIGVVAATGVVRATEQVPSWSALARTGYGQLVVAKAALLLLLACLGGVNRLRGVPAAAARPALLRRVGSVELGVATGALLVAALLVNAAPPVAVARGASGPAPVVVRGTDVATTVRLEVSVTPGTPGADDFRAALTDYGSGRPVDARDIVLHFDLPLLPDLGTSSLTLRRTETGAFDGRGANLAVDGAWRVSALVENGANSVEVPLVVETQLLPPPRIRQVSAPGSPTLYTIPLDGGRSVQVYVDPPGPGKVNVHATFFDASGAGLAATGGTIVGTPAGGTPTVYPVQQLEPGHYVASATVQRGAYRFDVTGVAPGGDRLVTHIDLPIGS